MRQRHVRQWALVLVALSVLSLCASRGVTLTSADDGIESDGNGVIYEWWNSTVYFGGNPEHWERWNPEGEPHPYNMNPDNWWRVPEGNRNDPKPYGASERTRNVANLDWYYYNGSRSEGERWVKFNPDGGAHPYNQRTDIYIPEWARDMAQPYGHTVVSVQKGAGPPEDWDGTGVTAPGGSENTPGGGSTNGTDSAEPEDEISGFLDQVDAWIDAIFGLIGIDNPFGSIKDYVSGWG